MSLIADKIVSPLRNVIINYLFPFFIALFLAVSVFFFIVDCGSGLSASPRLHERKTQ
jgi:hypothetical protein